jgi:hypothetical protein
MVESELPGLPTTILTGVLVATEYFKPGQFPSRTMWAPDHRSQSDYRWHRKFKVNRVNKAGAIFQHLRPVLLEQDNGPADTADIKWFIALVQYQYRQINHPQTLWLTKICPILLEKASTVQTARLSGIKPPSCQHGLLSSG